MSKSWTYIHIDYIYSVGAEARRNNTLLFPRTLDACRQICLCSDSEAIVHIQDLRIAAISVGAIVHIQDLRIAAISVGAIRESPLRLGLDFLCVSPAREFA